MSKGHVLAAMAMVILQCDAIRMFFGYTFIAIEFYLWFAIIEFEKISNDLYQGKNDINPDVLWKSKLQCTVLPNRESSIYCENP